MMTVRSRQKVSIRDSVLQLSIPIVHISSVLTVVGKIPRFMTAAEMKPV